MINCYCRSCSHRDKIGWQFISDMSWLTPHPINPLAIGQYVNNHTPGTEQPPVIYHFTCAEFTNLDFFMIPRTFLWIIMPCDFSDKHHSRFFTDNPANVCYQEFDFPETFPMQLHQFIPNISFSTSSDGILSR